MSPEGTHNMMLSSEGNYVTSVLRVLELQA